MDVGSAEKARSCFLPTHMDVGSAENAGAILPLLYMLDSGESYRAKKK